MTTELPDRVRVRLTDLGSLVARLIDAQSLHNVLPLLEEHRALVLTEVLSWLEEFRPYAVGPDALELLDNIVGYVTVKIDELKETS